jgi:hypothetical protein
VNLVNPRYERKYVVPGLSPPEVEAALALHPALFRTAFPPRSINNVYLDTPGLSDYLDHAHGAVTRAKLRVRWYGAADALTCLTLERKQRVGPLGGKQSYRLPHVGVTCADGWRFMASALAAADMPDGMRLEASCRGPVLLNRYERRYLVSADRRFRITIDSHLRFARPRPVDLARLKRAPALPGVIVELKFAPEDAPDGEAVGHALPFRLGQYSKYVTGVERLAR